MATVVMWSCLSGILDAYWLSHIPWKARCSKEQICYMVLWHLFVILYYRWLYWHQCTNWAHSSCVHMIKMHSIVLYLLQESWSTQMVQFSQRFMCITQCLTMFPQNSSHYSSPTCKFSSIYAFFSVYRDRITSVRLVHNRAPWGMGCQPPFHQCCILCITTTPESQISPRQYHNFYSQLRVTSVAALDFTCSKKVFFFFFLCDW